MKMFEEGSVTRSKGRAESHASGTAALRGLRPKVGSGHVTHKWASRGQLGHRRSRPRQGTAGQAARVGGWEGREWGARVLSTRSF